MQDFAFAWRLITRKPRASITIIIVLALATGPNIAVFQILSRTLFQHLPYPGADRIAVVYSTQPKNGLSRVQSSYQNVLDWKQQSRSFESLAAWSDRSANLAGAGGAERIQLAMVSPGFFDVFALGPVAGRLFDREEERPGRGDAVVVSYRFWQRYFGGRRDVPGRTIEIDRRRVTVVGVMPAAMAFPSPDIDVWQPIAREPDQTGERGDHWIHAIGRLRPDASVEDARSELEVIASRLARSYPEANEGWSATAFDLRGENVRDTRTALLAIWGAVLLVLLVGAFNAANLLLVRSSQREREFAVRAALGAPRPRLALQILIENTVLSLFGGIAGAGLAWVLGRVSTSLLDLPAAPDLSARTVAYTIALSLSVGLLLALVTLPRVLRSSRSTALREGSKASGGRARRRLQTIIVAGELGLTVALLVGALLLARTLLALSRNEPGFDARGTLTLRVAPPQQFTDSGTGMEGFIRQYAEQRAETVRFADTLLERVASIQGVSRAAVVNALPVTGKAWQQSVIAEGRADREPVLAVGRVVAGDYLGVMGIPLLQGRAIGREDRAGTEPVVMIGRSLASRLWPRTSAIGRTLRIKGPEAIFKPMRVVGVVGDVRNNGPRSDPEAAIYVPLSQAWFGFFNDWGLDIVVHTSGDPAPLAGPIRSEIARLDPSLPAFDVTTLSNLLRGATGPERRNAAVIGLFAGLALLLSIVGIYGVTSDAVAVRTREIGIRTALGATRAGVMRLILGEGLFLGVAGVTAGLALAAIGTRSLAGLLYGVEALDPTTYLIVAAATLLASLAANVVPAFRAAGIAPAVTLRDE